MPLPPTFPDLVSLDLFASVVDLGSVSRAAAAHGISQPSASARISGLERWLGINLLTRAPSGSVPTPEGAVVADWVGRLLAGASGLDTALQALRAQEGRPVRVVTTATLAVDAVPGWLVGARERYPATPVELEVADAGVVVAQVRAGRAALGFLDTPGRTTGVSSAAIGTDHLVVVVEPGHPWARRRAPLEAATLAATPLVARAAGSDTGPGLAEVLRRVGLEPAVPVLELGSEAAVKAAVLAGQGPAVLSRRSVEPELASGRLAVVAVNGLDLERKLRAVWPSSGALDGVAGELLALARRAGRANQPA